MPSKGCQWGGPSPLYEEPQAVTGVGHGMAQNGVEPSYRVLSTETLKRIDELLESVQDQLGDVHESTVRSDIHTARTAQSLAADIGQARANLEDEARRPRQHVVWSVE